MELDAYLARIGFTGSLRRSAEQLADLHRAHERSVPFENLDIHLGRPIVLDTAALFEKIVKRRRGGYCFELNGLMSAALGKMGYSMQTYLARVIYVRGYPGPRTHQLQIVQVDGRDWLFDVGFGGPGLHGPMPFEPDREEVQYGERFKLRRDSNLGYVLQKQARDGWIDLYAFELQAALPPDFEMANFYTSCFAQSFFRLNRIARIGQPGGSVTLMNFDLTVEKDGATERLVVSEGPAYLAKLGEHFGIELDARYENLMPLGSANAAVARRDAVEPDAHRQAD